MEQVVDAENDGHHHAEAEADVVDEVRHLAVILKDVGLGVGEIADTTYQGGKGERAEDEL